MTESLYHTVLDFSMDNVEFCYIVFVTVVPTKRQKTFFLSGTSHKSYGL